MANAFLGFSFLQGVLAFFAPCAVALLPGYIAAFVGRHNATKGRIVARASMLAGLSILGIVTVYVLAGILILTLNQLLKQAMPYIASAMGVVFIGVGVLMLGGKNVALNLHMRDRNVSSESLEAYLFGVAYGVGALGCLFPLFLLVAFTAIAAPFWTGVSYLAAYLAGMSMLMLLFTLLAVVAREKLMRHLPRVLPYVTRVAGGMMIIAGIYVIWYQSALF